MNFILNHKYADGNTPIRQEEAEPLIPRISTMGELNEYEAVNILRAREWAFDGRTMKVSDPLDELYVRELHSRMFDNVWKWAGTYRQTTSRTSRTAIANPAQNEMKEIVGTRLVPASSTGCKQPQQGVPGLCADDEMLKWLVPLTPTHPRACR
jgi:hypothetical protein